MKPFSSLTIIALSLLPSIVWAIELPPENCGADTPPTIMAPGDRVTKSWCVVYEEAAVLTSAGTTKDIAGATASCENCSPSCGKPELPQPREIKCKLTLETSFENKRELTVTGGFKADQTGSLTSKPLLSSQRATPKQSSPPYHLKRR